MAQWPDLPTALVLSVLPVQQESLAEYFESEACPHKQKTSKGKTQVLTSMLLETVETSAQRATLEIPLCGKGALCRNRPQGEFTFARHEGKEGLLSSKRIRFFLTKGR